MKVSELFLQPNTEARVVAVGEVNPYRVDPYFALYPYPRYGSGERLRQILGLSDEDYLRYLRRENLCRSRWVGREAEERAGELTTELAGTVPRVVILLGTRVAGAFRRIVVVPTFGSREWRDLIFVQIPHPSGLCRVWNDSDNVRRTRDLVREIAPWVPWGSWQPREKKEEEHARVVAR